MKTQFLKRTLALMLCGIVFALAGITSFADSGEYTATNGWTDETITVTYDGIEISHTESEERGSDVYAKMHRGETVSISFKWDCKRKDNINAIVSSNNKMFDGTSSTAVSDTTIESAEFKNKDGSLDWVEVVSKSEDEITLLITAPTDTRVKMVNVGAGAQVGAGYYGTIGGRFICSVHIELDDDTRPSSLFQTTTHDADTNPGEDDGVTIKNEIVDGTDIGDIASKVALTVGGALVTAGILGAATDKKDDEKKRKIYKMKVYKNFGDSIRRGANPVSVWARIVEVVDGVEEDRPDLSARITVSATGMNVQSLGVQNSYMGGSVSVPADSTVEKTILTFTFAGEGGVFRNNVIFKVIGDPKIAFPSMTEDGRGWSVNDDLSEVKMIAGAGGHDRLRFVILNVDQEPKAIRFRDHEGFDITYEKDPQFAFTYYAYIENFSGPIEKESGIFAAEKTIKVTVEAEFEDGVIVDNYFTIKLYPDGLSVAAEKIENGRMLVDTMPAEDQEALREPIHPTVFFVVLAYHNSDGRAVVIENPGIFERGELTDDGKYALLVKKNFEYSLTNRASSGIAFYPRNTLPSLGDPYEVRMPIIVTAEETGMRYRADLPMALMGEVAKPLYKDAARQKELELLKKDIKTYGLGDDPGIKALVRLANSGLASVDDIQDARRAVIQSAVEFYYEYGKAYKKMDALYSRYIVVAGTLVKAGDYAVEYLLKVKLGGYGGLAANIINPLKNLFATYIGEYVANGNIDKAPDLFVQTLLKGCEDALYAAISGVLFGGLKSENEADLVIKWGNKTLGSVTGNPYEEIQKILGYVITVYIMIRFIDHYTNGKPNERGDVFRSMVAACGDLTFKLLKAFVMDRIEKAASRVFEKLVTWCGEVFKSFCQGQVNQAVLTAGNKAFGDRIRAGLAADGQVTSATYWAAKSAKALAKKEVFLDAAKRYNPKPFTDYIIKETKSISDSKFYGTVINMILNPWMEEGEKGEEKEKWKEEGYGITSTKDAVVGTIENRLSKYLKKNLGITADKIYEKALNGLNPYEVSLYLANGNLVIGMLGYEAIIPMTGENFMAVAEMAFESMFSWLDAFWDMMENNVSVPDPRYIKLEKNVDRIKQELEEQKQRMENLEDVTFVCTKK